MNNANRLKKSTFSLLSRAIQWRSFRTEKILMIKFNDQPNSHCPFCRSILKISKTEYLSVRITAKSIVETIALLEWCKKRSYMGCIITTVPLHNLVLEWDSYPLLLEFSKIHCWFLIEFCHMMFRLLIQTAIDQQNERTEQKSIHHSRAVSAQYLLLEFCIHYFAIGRLIGFGLKYLQHLLQHPI